MAGVIPVTETPRAVHWSLRTWIYPIEKSIWVDLQLSLGSRHTHLITWAANIEDADAKRRLVGSCLGALASCIAKLTAVCRSRPIETTSLQRKLVFCFLQNELLQPTEHSGISGYPLLAGA